MSKTNETFANSGKFDGFTQAFVIIDLVITSLCALVAPMSILFIIIGTKMAPNQDLLQGQSMGLLIGMAAFSFLLYLLAILANILLLRKKAVGVKLALVSLVLVIISLVMTLINYFVQYDASKALYSQAGSPLSPDVMMMLALGGVILGLVTRMVYNFFYYKALRRAEKVINGEVNEVFLD